MTIISKQTDNSNTEKSYALEEIDKRKVVEHNDLITSIAKMDKTPLKIFELAVSCINTKEPPEDNTIYLSKKELFSFFKVTDNDKHTRFREAIEKMQKTSFFEIREKKKKGFKFKSILPVPFVEWNDYNDNVIIRFDQAIMPYLIELGTKFTQYAISDIMELNSKYSIILYKWFSMQYNQYQYYKNNGKRDNPQLEKLRNPSISIQELRLITDTINEYKEMSNFSRKILTEPINEINKNTHFNVTFVKNKKGRAVDNIQFFITKKKVAVNENYKLEQQDEDYLKGKQQKEEQQQKLFAQAIVSKYTTLLFENSLLSPYAMQKVELMADLQKMVYPYYEELENLKGSEGVNQHLSYVSSKQELYSKSKQNIPLYLKKSITSYLESVKIKEKLKK